MRWFPITLITREEGNLSELIYSCPPVIEHVGYTWFLMAHTTGETMSIPNLFMPSSIASLELHKWVLQLYELNNEVIIWLCWNKTNLGLYRKGLISINQQWTRNFFSVISGYSCQHTSNKVHLRLHLFSRILWSSSYYILWHYNDTFMPFYQNAIKI